jgi:hypothetical protein
MTLRARRLLGVLTLALATSGSASQLPGLASSDLPTKLTDQEFWRLMDDMSEQSGVFPSDNLLSNELLFARVVPDLLAHTKPGGVFLGVGPEQNFTYIAALQPKAAFIADIRRANLQLQLMYKALFELSADRADFVSATLHQEATIGSDVECVCECFDGRVLDHGLVGRSDLHRESEGHHGSSDRDPRAAAVR